LNWYIDVDTYLTPFGRTQSLDDILLMINTSI
jgi:hypothetical protein